MSRRISICELLRSPWVVVLVILAAGRDVRAEIQPTFDMNYCCENAKLIVVGRLSGNRLTVTQVLSSVRMGMATIEIQPNPATRLRSAMGKEPGDDIEVVAFLNEKNEPVLGVASLAGLLKNDVYLVHHSAGFIGLREQLEPAPYPALTRAKFLDATKSAIGLTRTRRQIAKRPRSTQRAEMLLDFLDEQAKAVGKIHIPLMWPDHHTRQVAAAFSPIHADEEQVILNSLRDTTDEQRRVRLLKLIADTPCTTKAFEPAANWIAPEHAREVRAAAITAIGRIDNYRAVDELVPLLKFDDPELPSLLTGLYTRGSSSQFWPRNPKAIATLERLTNEALIRQRRGEEWPGNSWGSRGLNSEADIVFGSMGGGRYLGEPNVRSCFSSLAILLLSVGVTSAEENPNRHVSRLRDMDDAVRASAAKQIREQLASDPTRRTRDAGRKYWENRIAQVKVGMKHEEVVEVLPSLTMQSVDELLYNGPGSGDWHYSGWRLDHYWTFTILYTNPDRVREPPQLRNAAMEVWVDPPKDHTGRWTTWFVNGQKHRESFHKEGQLHGTLTVYHDNGKKLYEQHYQNGECHGKDTGWNRDGSKSYEGQYVDGKQHGTWMHWHANGKPRYRSQLNNGKRDGTTTHWFENGQMQYEQQYKNGQRHGINRAWKETGEQLWSRLYRDGELISDARNP